MGQTQPVSIKMPGGGVLNASLSAMGVHVLWTQPVHPPEGLGKPVKCKLDKRDSKVYACVCTNTSILEVKIIPPL